MINVSISQLTLPLLDGKLPKATFWISSWNITLDG